MSKAMSLCLILLGAAGVVTLAAEGSDGPQTRDTPAPAATPAAPAPPPAVKKEIPRVGDKLVLTEEEWKKRLTPEQFKVLRDQGTERAFSGALWNEHAAGTFHCAGCGAPLFSSKAKFESGTGWPSFWEPIEDGRVGKTVDRSWFSVRTEVHCDRCGGHLGHVFDDGPQPTGLRYCINSVSLAFAQD